MRRRSIPFVAPLVAVCLATASAHAEPQPWYRGAAGKQRLLHLSITLGGGLAWLASDTVFKDSLAPDHCRWCDPPAFDEGMRNLLVWGDTRQADILSSIDAYVVAPIVGFGLLYASDHDAGLARLIDDTLPVAEAVVISQLVVQSIKVSVGRQRPFARFGSEVAIASEENLSFPSGHSSLGFAITAGAGMICHRRHYWTEPYVWGAGIALSVSVEYLRMAADKHYLSDVLVGGGIGLVAGLVIPRLILDGMPIVPTRNGFALVTTF